MTAVLKAEDPLMGAFAPAEGSYPMQTPYGSLQLNHISAAQQQQQPPPAITFLGVPSTESDEEEEDDDEDDEDGSSKGKRKRSRSSSKGGKKTAKGTSSIASVGTSGERDIHTGRRKIRIEFIEDDSRRHITFSKRKAGIMKKAYELATLTGTQVLLLIVSQTGLVYTFTTPKLSPVVQEAAGRELIQSCLNAPEPEDHLQQNVEEVGTDSNEGEETTEDSDQGLPTHQHFSNDMNTQQQQQQHQHQQLQHADLFQDPRNVMGMPTHLGNLAMNMPHLHGLSYGGYAGHHMNMHEQAIPYGSYGM